MEVQPIRLVVAEDDPLARRAIRAYVSRARGLEIVAEAADGVEALAEVEQHLPDVLLTDIHMPGLDGVELTYAVMQLPTPPSVVCFTALSDEATMRAALVAGACGFILKTDRPEVVIHGIRSAISGESVVSPRLLATVLATLTRSGSPPAELTPPERELLSYVGAGLSNAEIATRMYLSHATIKTYVSRLLAKTNSRNRAQLAARAYEWGLVRHDDPKDA